MIRAAHASGDVIRKAGKATLVLQTLAIALLLLVGYLYYDISTRYSSLQDGIRENALWSVYQLDREAVRFQGALEGALARGDMTASTIRTLSLRYDLLFSRVRTLKESRFDEHFIEDKDVGDQLVHFQASVFGYAPLFDRINAGAAPTFKEIRLLAADMTNVVSETTNLLTYTNNAVSAGRAEARSAILDLEMKTIFLLGLLIACVGCLVYTLRRQLRNVKAAGLGLEHMAERLNDAYQDAEAGNRAKSQFLATMGHEIRTPMNAILGMVELLELKPLPSEVMSYVKTIRRAGETLLEIINEILDFSKIEHRKLELEFKAFDLRQLIEGTADMMRGRAVESGNRIVVDMPAELSASIVKTDPTRLRQVILNLLSNGVKFTKDGTVCLRVRQTVKENRIALRVEVQDDGIGIDTDGQSKLFKPFSQVDASITRRYGGTGLGLTICKMIIEQLGGEFGVISEAGAGSTFWFEVLADRSHACELATGQTAPSKLPPLARHRILLVEDNAVNQQVAAKFLQHLGQDVSIAEDGQVAVDITARETFDVILMDMQMPVMDGIEATRLIRARSDQSSKTPIIAMTANASVDDRQLCDEAGMSGFEAKPITIARLHALLSDISSGHSASEVASPSSNPPTWHDDEARAFAARRAEIEDALGAEAFQELVETFFDDASTLLFDLRNQLTAGGYQSTDGLLHALKGSAGNVGFIGIAEMAQEFRLLAISQPLIDRLEGKVEHSRILVQGGQS